MSNLKISDMKKQKIHVTHYQIVSYGDVAYPIPENATIYKNSIYVDGYEYRVVADFLFSCKEKEVITDLKNNMHYRSPYGSHCAANQRNISFLGKDDKGLYIYE